MDTAITAIIPTTHITGGMVIVMILAIHPTITGEASVKTFWHPI